MEPPTVTPPGTGPVQCVKSPTSLHVIENGKCKHCGWLKEFIDSVGEAIGNAKFGE
jgi:hypothetical protein